LIKEVVTNIFQIKVPLPHSPLGHLNSYLIKSDERNLLIDTGLNFPEAFQSLCTGLSEAGTDAAQLTDIFATHFHVDHVGLIPRFIEVAKGVKLLIHQAEADLSKFMSKEFSDYMKRMETFLSENGAPPSIAANLQKFHPAFFTPQAYQELANTKFTVNDNQKISIGNYNFQILWTPGHSPGHTCLYEPALKILLSGDHILPTITPHVAQFMENMDPLTDYLNSLEKIGKLDVKVVLPAHEEIFMNHRERIKQLKEHHRQRLMEIEHALNTGSATAYSLASQVHWNTNCKSWSEFPSFQKYLALGETVAHLNLLEKDGLVEKRRENETIIYRAN
jgi:glyoxylase-like metal-dependent hydrolase (beta-lactamase superfamily II)